MTNTKDGCIGSTLHQQYVELATEHEIPFVDLATYYQNMKKAICGADLSLFERGVAMDICNRIYHYYTYSWFDRHRFLTRLLVIAPFLFIFFFYLIGIIRVG